MGKSDHETNEDEDEQTIWLKDFVFDPVLVPEPTILLVGKRFSGKSYTGVSIAEKFPVHRWAAFCGTKDTEDFWAAKFDSSASVRGPDAEGKAYLVKLIRYQQRKSRLYEKVLKLPFPDCFKLGLIFDDITSKREFRKGELLEDLFTNGRHYRTIIIISCQYLKQLPPAVRTNTDYMFLMHNTKRTCKILYEEYVEEPETFAAFLELLRSVTGQRDELGKDLFNSLVYDNVVKSSKIEDMFKVYRNEGKPIIDQMKLGSKEWREYNKGHYKDKDYEMQMREYRKRKRLLRIQEYHKRQMLKRQNPEMAISQELDYFSDSDSDSSEKHDTIKIGKRNGPKTTVNFSKKPRENNGGTSWNQQIDNMGKGNRNDMSATSSATGYSIPDNEYIPPPPPQYFQTHDESLFYDDAAQPLGYYHDRNNYGNPNENYQTQYSSPYYGGRNDINDRENQYKYSEEPEFRSWDEQQSFIRNNSRYLPMTNFRV